MNPSPEKEGRKAFMDKLPLDACPYERGKKLVQWKLGYHKQEYDELKEEQASILESMTYYSEPHTYLDEIISQVRSQIDKYNYDLSR